MRILYIGLISILLSSCAIQKKYRYYAMSSAELETFITPAVNYDDSNYVIICNKNGQPIHITEPKITNNKLCGKFAIRTKPFAMKWKSDDQLVCIDYDRVEAVGLPYISHTFDLFPRTTNIEGCKRDKKYEGYKA